MISRALGRAGPAAGITVVGLGLVAAVLVPAGWWRPAVAVPATVALAVLACWVTGRLDAPHDRSAPIDQSRDVDRRAWLVTLGLTVGLTLWTALTHAEHVVLRRDGGAYSLYTQWIATRHGLPVSADLAAFGGPAAMDVPRFSLHSPAFYQVLTGSGAGLQAEIVPQFLVGAPAVYSLGWWAGSAVGAPWTGLQVMPAIVTGLGMLAFAALVRRLVGAGWMPLAVGLLGASLPVVQTARNTYSEPVALLALLAAACLAVDALTVDEVAVDEVAGRRRAPAALAGAVLGLAAVIRVDAVREVALLLAVCAVLTVRGNRVAPVMAAGALSGVGASLLAWRGSTPYLDAIGASLRPLLVAGALVVAVAAVAVPIARRRPATPRPGGPWASIATAATALLGVVLVSRPLWLTVRQDPGDTGSQFVALLQSIQGLDVDGGRTYAEHSLQWVAWYLGWPALVAAWVVLAVLAGRAVTWWRAADGDPPPWLLPAAVAFGSGLLVLYRPGITPDHPWATRRLVPVVMPLVVLAATVAIRWAVGRGAAWAIRRRAGSRPRDRRVVPAVGVWALGALAVVPVLWATVPLAVLRTERGEPDAVRAVCATLRPDDVVVAVDATPDGAPGRSASEWVQVIRGVCGRPSGSLLAPADQLAQASARLAALVEGAGGRLVLLTGQTDEAEARRVLSVATGSETVVGETVVGQTVGAETIFGEPRRAVRLQTVEDRKRLEDRPASGIRLVIDVWTVAALPPSGRT